MQHSSPFIQLTVLLQLKPVLLIMFDISLISFIYIPSAPTRRLPHTSFHQRTEMPTELQKHVSPPFSSAPPPVLNNSSLYTSWILRMSLSTCDVSLKIYRHFVILLK